MINLKKFLIIYLIVFNSACWALQDNPLKSELKVLLSKTDEDLEKAIKSPELLEISPELSNKLVDLNFLKSSFDPQKNNLKKLKKF